LGIEIEAVPKNGLCFFGGKCGEAIPAAGCKKIDLVVAIPVFEAMLILGRGTRGVPRFLGPTGYRETPWVEFLEGKNIERFLLIYWSLKRPTLWKNSVSLKKNATASGNIAESSLKRGLLVSGISEFDRARAGRFSSQ
jgi:hypothetical protein